MELTIECVAIYTYDTYGMVQFTVRSNKPENYCGDGFSVTVTLDQLANYTVGQQKVITI